MTKTYFIDIDGVLIAHSGKGLSGQMFSVWAVEEAKKLINEIDKTGGKIVLTTGRKESMRELTARQLEGLSFFYDALVMGCNRGPRVLINDLKPNYDTRTAYSFNLQRNKITDSDIEKIITPCEEREWGNFSTLSYCDGKYHIKEINVLPGKFSSLQSHNFREEVWVVISGIGECTLGDKIILLSPGSIIKVALNQKHRIKNTGSEKLTFIEIQTGTNFSEHDITRY